MASAISIPRAGQNMECKGCRLPSESDCSPGCPWTQEGNWGPMESPNHTCSLSIRKQAEGQDCTLRHLLVLIIVGFTPGRWYMLYRQRCCRDARDGASTCPPCGHLVPHIRILCVLLLHTNSHGFGLLTLSAWEKGLNIIRKVSTLMFPDLGGYFSPEAGENTEYLENSPVFQNLFFFGSYWKRMQALWASSGNIIRIGWFTWRAPQCIHYRLKKYQYSKPFIHWVHCFTIFLIL